MTNTSIVLGSVMLVVGLSVGVVVGWTTASSPQTDAPVAAPRAAGGPAAPSPPSDDPSAPTRRASRRGAADAAAADARADAAPASRRGEGQITGRVADAQGAPLAGVLVRVSPAQDWSEWEEEAPSTPGAAPPRVDVEHDIARYAAMMRRTDAGTREATTDAQGAYAVAGVVGKSLVVSAWRPGWRLQRTGASSSYVRVGDRCDFSGVPLHGLTVSVLLPDGSSPPRAQIAWTRSGDPGGNGSPWTPKQPRIDLEPGAYEVSASAGDAAEDALQDDEARYCCEAQPVTVGAEAGQSLSLHLTERAGVRVRVVYAGPEHPRTVRVAVARLDGGAAPDPALLLAEGDSVESRWLEDRVETSFTDLEPGAYLVGATFRGGFVGPSATVVVADRLATQELHVAAPPRDWVKTWVRGPDGRPLSDVTFTVGLRYPQGGENSSSSVATADADGSFRVEYYESGAPCNASSSGGQGQDAAERPTSFIRATSRTYADAEASYDPATAQEVTVQFTEPARLDVTLAGFAASPDRDRASLQLMPRGEWRGGTFGDGQLDATGKAAFAALRPGAYDLIVNFARDEDVPRGIRKLGGGRRQVWGGEEVARKSVVVVAGENALTIPMPSVSEIVVVVEESFVGSLSLQRVEDGDRLSDLSNQWRQTGGAREFVYPNLRPGRYRVHGPTGDMWFDVPAERRLAFKPRPFNALRAWVEPGDDGVVPDTALRDGDLLVAVDGAEFESTLQTEALLAVARTRDSAKLTVLRGGRRFETTADVKQLDQTVRLEPWSR